ncbi:MAG: transcriptional regulator, LacI family [Chthonomonadaceae bacterium]|nr:transcriptional regulator, LacI family [Chthonomonadaceae bacterium]
MPVTAKDIARELGLSQSTVSRILNGDERHRVSVQTRERILSAARRLDYQPNALAQSLRRGRTNVVGLYTSHRYDARNDFLSEILGGLQLACARHRLDLLLHCGYPGRTPDDTFNALRDGRMDGLFLHTSPEDPLVARLSASAMHVVALADPLPNLPTVTCDDVSGMQQIVAAARARGYRRFAFLAPQFQLASVERRREAWEQQMREQEVSPEDVRVFRVPVEDANAVLDDLLFWRTDRPIAVACWNDRTAYSLLRACAERGVAVPDQIAVTGFDGFLDDKLPARRLTTIGCPWVDVAVQAVELLVRGISGETLPTETILPVTLLPGDTI